MLRLEDFGILLGDGEVGEHHPLDTPWGSGSWFWPIDRIVLRWNSSLADDSSMVGNATYWIQRSDWVHTIKFNYWKNWNCQRSTCGQMEFERNGWKLRRWGGVHAVKDVRVGKCNRHTAGICVVKWLARWTRLFRQPWDKRRRVPEGLH